jgi:hypothetical protein
MRSILLACLLASPALAQPSNQPTGGVSGRVVNGSGGVPVRGAFVQLTGIRASEEFGSTWSGEDGRFSIEGIPPGRFVLNASKPAIGNYGFPVEVRSGAVTRDVEIPMQGPAVLAGRVTDADDLPVAGARASIEGLGHQYGRIFAFGRGAAETDDRGELRATLDSPGRRYMVVLQPPAKPDVAGTYRLLHPPLFYPNAVNPAEAQPVRIDRGMKIETLDFEAPGPADTHLLILAKAGVPGQSPRSCVRCSFSLQARHAETWLEVLSGQSDRSGRIEIHGVHPGTYRLAVIEGSSGELYAGYEDFVIAEKGQTKRYEITAWAANSIPVTVTLVDPPEDLRDEEAEWRAALIVTPLEPRYPGGYRPPIIPVQGRGTTATTRMALPPGQWALRLNEQPPLPRSVYIEQVIWGGRPQRGPFMGVSRQGFSARVEVRIGFAAPTLTGTVSGGDPAGRLAPLVRVQPEPPDGYGHETTLVVASDRSFSTEELSPGTYTVFAVLPSARDLDFSDPEVRARYANHGKRVVLEPGGSHRVELEAIP